MVFLSIFFVQYGIKDTYHLLKVIAAAVEKVGKAEEKQNLTNKTDAEIFHSPGRALIVYL